ncbi:putative glycosyltransferase 6 domain-containing protein 1 [Vulpes lagopus]|uniref:putative glycosyltransferase 6 domain-containing protein 1 n=1 Tax=Vulpes lagopus TaxID=494514 RepID=UPI001BC8F538|nr:putative glycosyltransferase 6 domain-containing protein 1 [Vulpes lagopus]
MHLWGQQVVDGLRGVPNVGLHCTQLRVKATLVVNEGGEPMPSPFTASKLVLRDEVELRLSDWFNPRKRPDVVTTTDWLAPVIWEGTFNRRVLEEYYRGQDLTIGLAVLATGRTADQYLELFMQSANKHFMTGYRVIFYIMVDAMCQLPNLEPGPLQTFQVFTIREDSREDFHLMHMKNLASHILGHIQDEVDFLFSMTANRVFQNDFGVETLGTSVAQLHAWWYFKDIKDFPYERRFRSAACILLGEGDFYYDGSVVGGTPLEILDFIQEYLEGMIHDKENGLNSTYERYLNKYFFTHKPTKLLSPEYSWDTALQLPAQIWLVKAAQCSHMCLHT